VLKDRVIQVSEAGPLSDCKDNLNWTV